MTRRSEYFFLATFSAMAAWVIGIFLIGFADITYSTASGSVDMTSAGAVSRALTDPTFTTEVEWGSIALAGHHWTFSFPLLSALIAFTTVLLIGRIRRPMTDRWQWMATVDMIPSRSTPNNLRSS